MMKTRSVNKKPNRVMKIKLYLKEFERSLAPKQYRHGHKNASSSHIGRFPFSDSRQLPESSQHPKNSESDVIRNNGSGCQAYPVLFRSIIEGNIDLK